MITGSEKQRIKRYRPIDHCGSGAGDFWIEPEPGEKFVGIPYGFEVDGSMPYIEVRRGGNLFKTVNALDVSEIEFDAT